MKSEQEIHFMITQLTNLMGDPKISTATRHQLVLQIETLNWVLGLSKSYVDVNHT